MSAGASSRARRDTQSPRGEEAAARGRAPALEVESQAPARPPALSPLGRTLLLAVVLVALVLRLREPLSSPVIGAEDPYLHMERTWDVVSGRAPGDYPIGFMLLLAPFAWLGTDAFYWFVRFAPVLLGVASVGALFLLARPWLGEGGALAAALILALTPEHILRTDLLFPTGVDLALLPILFLLVLRAAEGRLTALLPAAALAGFLGFVHPWVLGVLLPPLLVFGLVLLARRRERPAWTGPAVAASFVIVPLALWLVPFADPWTLVFDRALPRLGALVSDPGSLTPLPAYVHYPKMLTVPVLALAGIGAVLTVVRPTTLSLFALTWILVLFPLTLVDWFDVWYLPHRTVAYMALGVALLAALPVAEGLRWLGARRPRVKESAPVAALAVLLVAMLPGALAAPTWYRLYTEDDYDAWEEIAARDPSLVVASSWQARAGYRAMTGEKAVFDPTFFKDEGSRNWRLGQHPDLVVLVDDRAEKEGRPTAFLADWTPIGEWGETRAFVRSNG